MSLVSHSSRTATALLTAGLALLVAPTVHVGTAPAPGPKSAVLAADTWAGRSPAADTWAGRSPAADTWAGRSPAADIWVAYTWTMRTAPAARAEPTPWRQDLPVGRSASPGAVQRA